MKENDWIKYTGENIPDLTRKVEVRGLGHLSGVYHCADEIQWDWLNVDGVVEWRYV